MSRSVSWSCSCTARLSPANIAWILAVAASQSFCHHQFAPQVQSRLYRSSTAQVDSGHGTESVPALVMACESVNDAAG